MSALLRKLTPRTYNTQAPELITLFQSQQSWLESAYPTLASIPAGGRDTPPEELVRSLVSQRAVDYYAVRDTADATLPVIGFAAIARVMLATGATLYDGAGVNYLLHESRQPDTALHRSIAGALIAMAVPKAAQKETRYKHEPLMDSLIGEASEEIISLEEVDSTREVVPLGVMTVLNGDNQAHAPQGLIDDDRMVPQGSPTIVLSAQAGSMHDIFRLGQVPGQLYFADCVDLEQIVD